MQNEVSKKKKKTFSMFGLNVLMVKEKSKKKKNRLQNVCCVIHILLNKYLNDLTPNRTLIYTLLMPHTPKSHFKTNSNKPEYH